METKEKKEAVLFSKTIPCLRCCFLKRRKPVLFGEYLQRNHTVLTSKSRTAGHAVHSTSDKLLQLPVALHQHLCVSSLTARATLSDVHKVTLRFSHGEKHLRSSLYFPPRKPHKKHQIEYFDTCMEY